jgi:thymidylate synthase (FAD)
MPQKPGVQGMLEKIESAARTCYRSEGFTKYDEEGNSITAKEFVERIVKTYKHESVAEHGTVYLLIKKSVTPGDDDVQSIIDFYQTNQFSKVVAMDGGLHYYYYITTNYRVIIENKREHDLQYWSEPTMYHPQRYTVRIFTDRGVSAEANRHRSNSPTERSTRFVNYGHDGAITVQVPGEIDDREIVTTTNEWGGPEYAFRSMCTALGDEKDNMFGPVDAWIFANSACEWAYLRLLGLGWKPQQARRILPMDVETELVITAWSEDWAKFFGWRYFGFTGTPHPDIKVVTADIMNEFVANGWYEPIEIAQQKYQKN